MTLDIELSATHGDLLACLETVGHFGVAAKVGPEVMARARIVIEELYSNTIKYGYGGECERRVALRLCGGRPPEVALTVVYEDDAPPFDPTGWNCRDSRPSAAESLREGEAGLALLFGLASGVAYEPRADGNRLIVVFNIPSRA